MAIVVTGASGRLGRRVVEHLLARGIEPSELVATGRSLDRLADLATRGVRVEKLDYDDVPEGILVAGDVLVFVSGSEVGRRAEQHRNVVEAAARAGVSRIVYTSAPSADDTTLAVAPEHAFTEELIRNSGLTYTFLRNGWYHENFLPAFQQAARSGVVLGSAGQGRVASAAIGDYAEAAAVAALDDGHDNAVHELSGDVAWSFDDLAATFAGVLGREVVYQPVPAEEHRAALVGAGLDEGTAGFVVAIDKDISDGLLGVTTGELTKLIGRPTTPLSDAVRSWL